MKPFLNLYVNTEYSLLESTIRVDALISYAKDKQLPYLSITDHNTMFGVAEFVEKCKKANIKPIIGLDLDVDDFRLILLAKNYEGYISIVKLSSKKSSGEKITLKDIPARDIFIIDHPTLGSYATKQKFLNINEYYVGLIEDELPNGVAVNFARTMDYGEEKVLSVLHSIKTGEEKEFQVIPYTHNINHAKTMVDQAIIIAKKCNVIFPKVKNMLPVFATSNNLSSIAYLKKIITKNAKEKLKNIDNKLLYIERIKYEVSIIEMLGFADYFLIIWDLIIWAKNRKINVGPGRGSVAGSVVAFFLNITTIDSIKFGLLFERFLNPARKTMPDIDVDIPDNRRNEVIDYLFNKYGSDKTALIITFTKFGAKLALRDVARVFKWQQREVEQLSKKIKPGEKLQESYNNNASFRAMVEKDKKTKELFLIAKSIEGLPKNHGTHAAGIVLSQNSITNYIPTIKKGTKNYNHTQFSMDYMEINGLLKIDILGLHNLTIIANIEDEIFQNHNKKNILKNINLNDTLTNSIISNVDTNGIFQLESYGMKNTLAQVGADNFDDVVSILALYRPGPIEFIKKYAERKKGQEKVPNISSEFDKVTKNTFGIIVFQEQIMQIAQEFAGMSFSQADILRRAISKKKKDLINSLKITFINGALKKSQKPKDIKKVFKSIESFSKYGFNKSHAVSYAVISYCMAFLKARFPIEFYTSLLNASIDLQTLITTYVNEAKNKSIKVVSPDINLSEDKVFNKNKIIYMPLKLIKGFGEAAQKKLLEERKTNGLFKDIFDFIARIKMAGINDSTILALINSNSLRRFGNMQQLLDTLPSAQRYANMITYKKNEDIILDFNLIIKPIIIKSKRNLNDETIMEKKFLGHNYNVFFTDPYKTKQKLIDLKTHVTVNVAIYVDNISMKKDKNNNIYAQVFAHDDTNQINFIIFAKQWKLINKSKPKRVYIATIKKNKFKNKEFFILKESWEDVYEKNIINRRQSTSI